METSTKEILKLCIQSSVTRLKKIKSGKDLREVLNNQENSKSFIYPSPKDFIPNTRFPRIPNNLKTPLNRSHSEKLEQKSDISLQNSFIDKIRTVAGKVEVYNKRCSILFPKPRRDRRPTIIKKKEEPVKASEDIIGRKIAKIDEEILNEIYKESYYTPLKIEIENKTVEKFNGYSRNFSRKIMCTKASTDKRRSTGSLLKTPMRNCENSIGYSISPLNLTPVMVRNSVKRINPHRHFAG